MLTKTSAELTLFDTLSRLTLARATKLLGADGNRLIAAGGKYDIDVATQVEFDQQRFRLALNGSAVTLALSPSARDRLECAVILATFRVSMPALPSLSS